MVPQACLVKMESRAYPVSTDCQAWDMTVACNTINSICNPAHAGFQPQVSTRVDVTQQRVLHSAPVEHKGWIQGLQDSHIRWQGMQWAGMCKPEQGLQS